MKRLSDVAEWKKKLRAVPPVMAPKCETCGSFGTTVANPDYPAMAALVAGEIAVADERRWVNAKMLRYIAFVLTGDEQADAQLAVDTIKAERDALRAEVARLRGRVTIYADGDRDGMSAVLSRDYSPGKGVICVTSWTQLIEALAALAEPRP